MSRNAERRPGESSVAIPAPTDAGLIFIGRIVTPWISRQDCPRRGDPDHGPACHLEVDPHWVEALEGIEPGMRIQVLTWLHLARRDLVRQWPRGRAGPTGTFSLRSPMRPNPVGSSVVRVAGRDGCVLRVHGLDCVSGTPLLDIKPERCPMAP